MSNTKKSVRPANPWVLAFRAGTHTDVTGKTWTFSEADIEEIASKSRAQIAGGYEPPLVLGHPSLDAPRQGSIKGAFADRGDLWLRVDELDPTFAEAAQKGQYKYHSIMLYPDKRIRHLGILGAVAPAIKGLPEFAFGEGAFAESDKDTPRDELLMFAEAGDYSGIADVLSSVAWKIKGVGRLFRSLRDDLIARSGVDAADRVLPEYTIQDLQSDDLAAQIAELRDMDDETALLPTFSEPAPVVPESKPPEPTPPAPVAPEPKPPDPEVEQLKARNAQLEEQLAQQANAAKRAAFAERLDSLTQEGRLLPSQRAQVEKLFESQLSNGLAFAEGENPLDGLLDALPQQVAFGEMPIPTRLPSSKNPLVTDAEKRHRS